MTTTQTFWVVCLLSMLEKDNIYTKYPIWNTIWGRPYFNYEKHHKVFWDLVTKDANGTILDLGCGSGSCWKSFKNGKHITGVDISDIALEEFKKNVKIPNITICTSVENLNIGMFDTVVLSGVVNYYRDLSGIKSILVSSSKDGGTIIITINVIHDFEDRYWDDDLIRKEFGFLGDVCISLYPKIGYFILIKRLLSVLY